MACPMRPSPLPCGSLGEPGPRARIPPPRPPQQGRRCRMRRMHSRHIMQLTEPYQSANGSSPLSAGLYWQAEGRAATTQQVKRNVTNARQSVLLLGAYRRAQRQPVADEETKQKKKNILGATRTHQCTLQFARETTNFTPLHWWWLHIFNLSVLSEQAGSGALY